MTTAPQMSTPTVQPGRSWWSIGVLVTELAATADGGVVAEATLPEGASPPLHMHDDLDDSFYVVDGRMVMRCGDEVWIAEPGDWVEFPMGVPHTFRVMDGPARVLLVHDNDHFLSFVRDLGRSAEAPTLPPPGGGPSLEALATASAAHGITNIGGCMEESEARAILAALVARQPSD